MSAGRIRTRLFAFAMVLCWLVFLAQSRAMSAAPPASELIAHLEHQLGLTDRQVRGALGTLLVFARARLPQPEFDELARRMPNADQIMQAVKLQGVVTRPLDDLDDYEESLANLGISKSVAAQFGPAVVDWLGSAGFHKERDMLAGVLH
jgi:hypothetical protein